MEITMLTVVGVVGIVSVSALDAIRNDGVGVGDYLRRMRKGLVWGGFLSLVPCLLLFLANQDGVKKGEPAYTLLQWLIALPLSALLFTTLFTLLFVFRPHPSNNSFGFLQSFTLLFWASAVALLFYLSVYIVNQAALLAA
ncbi:hypothetical protein [Corallincola spongiicola]|uniref:DUF2269 family protein n=1 Tax=Corallincola spongiicola TaxID=2520508 RepID=A0ABY1WV60_9GAMM|nr:hypothetical protein [Corallincola spongiicola]TAA48641.1 hypothetical protein EXY25_05330 [Corallincola spongiicola]